MKQVPQSKSGVFAPRVIGAFLLCSAGVVLATLSLAATMPNKTATLTAKAPNALSVVNRSVSQSRVNVKATTSSLVTQSTGWSIVSSPNIYSYDELLGVSCASASECWAVGSAGGKNLLEEWDGTSWTIGTSAPSGNQGEVLSSITCASSSECWATGNGENQFHAIDYPGTYYDPFFEHKIGSAWNAVGASGQGTPTYIKLNGVACASASDCWAVGILGGNPIIKRWTGSSWNVVPAPGPPTNLVNLLNAVSCVSTSDCWAVGLNAYYLGNDRELEHTLIEQWNGNEWLVVSSPNTSSTKDNALVSVACGSESECWAVGYYVDDAGHHQALIERWDGYSWIIVSSPSNGTQENQLNGGTCALASDCWAVGSYVNSIGVSQTLIEQWNGSSWEIVSSPNTSGTHNNRLNSVTCVSESDCWAVGSSDDTGAPQTLIEHWTPPVQLVSAVSRKSHGNAGVFDIDLPLTSKPGIECRSGGPSGMYQVIATFAAPVTMKGASVMYGSGSASSAAVSGSQVTVNLTGVTNAQTTIVRIAGVNDGTNSASVDIPLGVLLGDTTANGSVNASDLAQTKSASGQALTTSNCREDVTADGVINASDTTAVKAVSGTALH